MQEKPVLEARIVEQARLDHLGERDRVVLDALRMQTRSRILCLECIGERGHGLPVGVLQQPPLGTLDLDDSTQVTGVNQELLGVAFAPRDEPLRRRLVEPVDQRDQLQRTERLVEDRARAGLLRLRRRRGCPGQQDDRRWILA